ncbi:hypothetical protein [Gracilimonas sp.]|uniref:hypothetical protein n=1 Tax=Gracilimonas sp. TaxID=1974203 RepID=UPI003D127242
MFEFIELFIPLVSAILIIIIAFFVNEENRIKLLVLVSFLIVLIFYATLFFYLHSERLYFYDVYDWAELNYAAKGTANEYYLHIAGLLLYQLLTLTLIYRKFVVNPASNA